MATMTNRATRVLLVEDDPSDVKLTLEVLAADKIAIEVDVAVDGRQALQLLHQQDESGHRELPDLILLDLALPGLGGLNVVRQMKADDVLREIPVVILTSSTVHEDMIKSYELQVDGYITKPLDLHQVARIVHSVDELWLTIVKAPRALSAAGDERA